MGAEEALQHQDDVGVLALVLDLPLVGVEVVAEVDGVGEVSRRTRNGRVAAISAGTSTKLACSTRLADQGAPPTFRRISTYSIGFATLPSSMLASSHMDSLRRFLVLSANRSRQSGD
jgi:hypothetical protein